MKNLFAYGTLLVPEIWKAVVGKEFPSEPASLPGYEIRRVVNEDFPGIRPSPESDAQVLGKVFLNLDSGSIRRLDAYEGSLYDRINVTLRHQQNTPLESDVFVIPARNDDLLSMEKWSLEWFLGGPLQDYLTRLKKLI